MPVLVSDVDAAMRQLLDRRSHLLDTGDQLAPATGARRWCQLVSTNQLDAWLIAWGADSALAAHDHGDSHAAIHVLRGCLVEWYRDRDDRAAWNVRELAAGRTVNVPLARVHEVHQSGPEAAVSLHVYSPPLRSMRTHLPVQSLGMDHALLAGPVAARRIA